MAGDHHRDLHDTTLPRARQRALVRRIYAFIEERLGDPALSPNTIAAAHHISTRYLHKLFENEGCTVAAWVRRRRLERCAHDLTDPRLWDRPVSAVAARWGFADGAHFSRVFRVAYGEPPGRYRARRLAYVESSGARWARTA